MHSIWKKAVGLAVILALAGVGCGGDDGDSADSGDATSRIESFGTEAKGAEAKQAEAALSGYLDARAAEQWDKACSYLVKPTRRQFKQIAIQSEKIEGESCAAGLAALSTDVSAAERAALADAEAESVRVDGSEGYVLYVDDEGARFAIRAEREEGEWRFSGSPRPLSE